MKEYTQADWDEYAEWAAEAAKVPYEELDAPWIVVNRGPDDIHPARSKWEAYQIAKSLNYSFESFLMVNPDTAEDALRADIWDGDPEDIPPTMGREAELAVAAALLAIEKQIREQVAADIWEYWDACGDLIDDRDSARHAATATRAGHGPSRPISCRSWTTMTAPSCANASTAGRETGGREATMAAVSWAGRPLMRCGS